MPCGKVAQKASLGVPDGPESLKMAQLRPKDVHQNSDGPLRELTQLVTELWDLG
jgi:hypothetical protein